MPLALGPGLRALLGGALLAVLLFACPGGVRGAGVAAGVDVRDVATRHYYNPFDGMILDHTPYPDDLIDDAEGLLAALTAGGDKELVAAAGRDGLKVSSLRVREWSPGKLAFLAILTGASEPCFLAGTFVPGVQGLGKLEPYALSEPRLFVSLGDLTLSLTSSDGQVVIVDPIGAGGYRQDGSGLLMTPVMDPAVTRTPGRAFLPPAKYRGQPSGAGYMIPSRTHPDYYEGLPFVRLRRFDQAVDEYGIHGPISKGGTFSLPPALRGERLVHVRELASQQRTGPARLLERLADEELIADEDRLVRGRISNGCIRLRARDIRELYPVLASLPLGAPVTVAYRPDPAGVSHPFPWESKRFAIATDEKDEEGLTIMFTGEIKNRAGSGEAKLPQVTDTEIASEDAACARAILALASRSRRPADLRRLTAASAAARRSLADAIGNARKSRKDLELIVRNEPDDDDVSSPGRSGREGVGEDRLYAP